MNKNTHKDVIYPYIYVLTFGMHLHMNKNTHKDIFFHIHMYVTCIYVYTLINMYIYINTMYIYVYMHTYICMLRIHTYICILYVHMYAH